MVVHVLANHDYFSSAPARPYRLTLPVFPDTRLLPIVAPALVQGRFHIPGVLRRVAAPLLHWNGRVEPRPSLTFAFYLQNPGFPKWAMLGSNQRPPPCKLGQGFPTTLCPVRKFRLSERFMPF